MTTGGVVTATYPTGASNFSPATRMVVGPDGALWFTEDTEGTPLIGRLQ
jgi:streptogramin lyase